MAGRATVIAVVDAAVDPAHTGPLVWWVETEAGWPNRLCGAWTLDPADVVTLEALTAYRMVVATNAGADALAAAGVAPDRVVDLPATVAGVLAERDRLRAAFDAEAESRPPSKQLKPLTWPGLPAGIDVENPPAWDVNHPAEDFLDRCLSLAHFIAALCDRWGELEEARLARKFLRDLAGQHERRLPVVLAS